MSSGKTKNKLKNPVHVELGSKLWKFQQNLGITQEALGAKFSTKRDDEFARVYSKRMIQGYESGENELSGELLLNIWKAGFSVDDFFAEKMPGDSSQTAQETIDESSSARQSQATEKALDLIHDIHAGKETPVDIKDDERRRSARLGAQDQQPRPALKTRKRHK